MNHNATGFTRRQASGKGEPRTYRVDEQSLLALEGIGKWFEDRRLCYSDTLLVRAAIREYLEHLQAAPEADFEKIAEAVEATSGVRGRRVR